MLAIQRMGRNVLSVTSLAWVVSSALALVAPPTGPFYVSPAGNDAWSGTIPSPSNGDGPFLTPGRAATAVAAIQRPLTGGVNVWLRAGVYPLSAPLELTGALAGGDSPDATVRWGKYTEDAGDAVLSGTAPLTGWVATTTPGIWQTSLPAAAPPRCRELFVDQRRATAARVPPVTGNTSDDLYSDLSTLHFVSSLSGCGFKPPECFASNCPEENQWGCVITAAL